MNHWCSTRLQQTHVRSTNFVLLVNNLCRPGPCTTLSTTSKLGGGPVGGEDCRTIGVARLKIKENIEGKVDHGVDLRKDVFRKIVPKYVDIQNN